MILVRIQAGGFGCPSFLSYECYRNVTESCKYLTVIYYKPVIRSIF
nr:MAG TPA: Carbon catabolite derepressing protein kinase [Bacteriophage sp.]